VLAFGPVGPPEAALITGYDEAVLRQHHDVHNNAVGLVAEARWYGSQFLIQASDPDILPYRMAQDLLYAVACYTAEHRLMWERGDLAGGNGNPDACRGFSTRPSQDEPGD
jgi:hypothetical protein